MLGIEFKLEKSKETNSNPYDEDWPAHEYGSNNNQDPVSDYTGNYTLSESIKGSLAKIVRRTGAPQQTSKGLPPVAEYGGTLLDMNIFDKLGKPIKDTRLRATLAEGQSLFAGYTTPEKRTERYELRRENSIIWLFKADKHNNDPDSNTVVRSATLGEVKHVVGSGGTTPLGGIFELLSYDPVTDKVTIAYERKVELHEDFTTASGTRIVRPKESGEYKPD